MLMYGEKQIGFVYQGKKVINKIIKNGELIHEKGFTREKTDITPIYFKGVGSNLKKYSIKGNSIQNGTPTPDNSIDVESVGELTNICPYHISSWESGMYSPEGYKNDYGGRIRLKELLSVKPNTTYHFNTFNTEGFSFIVRYYDSSKTFLGNAGGIANKSTFTTNSETCYLGITLYTPNSTSVTFDEYKESFENGSVKPFICLNSEINKEYNKYKIPIKSIGQNLFDKNDLILNSSFSVDKDGFITATYDNSEGTTRKYVNIYGKNGLNLKENTSYTIIVEIKNVSGEGKLLPCSMLNSSVEGQFDTTWTNNFNELSNNLKVLKRVTTRTSLKKLKNGLRTLLVFEAGQSGFITFRISVLADTSITTDKFEYKPYEEKEINIYLNEPLRKVGDYVDYIDFDDKKVIRNIKKDIITSSLEWEMRSNANQLTYFRYKDDKSKTNTTIISNKLIDGYIWTAKNGNYIQKSISDTTVNYLIDTIKTLDDFKTLLDEWESEGNPLYALLVLETPTEESIELPDIETYDGDNNLVLDTTDSEMYIKYKSRV
jgi:hypothetical protein